MTFYLILATGRHITSQCLNVGSLPELFYTGEIRLDEWHAVWFVLLYDAILEGLKPVGTVDFYFHNVKMP